VDASKPSAAAIFKVFRHGIAGQKVTKVDMLLAMGPLDRELSSATRNV
jgi:hypothetical protein